jgi:ATP-dependent helicase/nuclease subunit B
MDRICAAATSRTLLVLGASTSVCPGCPRGRRVFDAERQELRELSLELGDGSREAIAREYALIYNCLTLPSESLYVSFAAGDGTGESRPSFVVDRLRLLFRREIRTRNLTDARSSAREPALELAVSGRNDGFPLPPDATFSRMKRAPKAAEPGAGCQDRPGPVGAGAVHALYGDVLHLTAT